MNEDTCRKAFLDVWNNKHGMGAAKKAFDFALSVLESEHQKDFTEMAAAFYIGFQAAWNLKPKLSVEEIGKIINDMLYYNQKIKEIAQAIYDKQEKME